MSKFQQRHYEAIAEVMQDVRTLQEDAELSDTCIHMTENLLVDMFLRDNCLFNPSRFRKACTPGANVKARTQ